VVRRNWSGERKRPAWVSWSTAGLYKLPTSNG
jgi:hypothetical protein